MSRIYVDDLEIKPLSIGMERLYFNNPELWKNDKRAKLYQLAAEHGEIVPGSMVQTGFGAWFEIIEPTTKGNSDE